MSAKCGGGSPSACAPREALLVGVHDPLFSTLVTTLPMPSVISWVCTYYLKSSCRGNNQQNNSTFVGASKGHLID